ncbi:MAG TPA: response regulator, partial [Actinomycetota bacterium]
MRASVGLLLCDEQLRTRWHAALAGSEVSSYLSVDDTKAALERGDKLDILVLGPGVSDPSRVAQEINRLRKGIETIVLAPDPEALRRVLLLTPYISRSITCLSSDDHEATSARLADAVEAVRKKKAYRSKVGFRSGAQAPMRAPEAGVLLPELLPQIPVGVAVMGPGRRILSWNAEMTRLFELPGHAAIGSMFQSILAPEHRPDLDRLLEELEEGAPQAVRRVFDIQTRHGQDVSYEIAAKPLAGTAGENLVLLTVHDVTARRLVDEHVVARAAAEAAAQARAEFLANMSHEIRTPMNAVIGMASMLLDTPLTAEQADFVATIRSSGDHLLTIINDILDFSKIEAGKVDVERAPFGIRRCVEDSLALVAEKASSKALDLAYVMDESVPEGIVGDAGRVRQVLMNLLSNAIKFTEHGEVVVELTARLVDGVHEVSFAVRDTGIGIPAATAQKLFRPFTQADASTTRVYGGTGLGLAISRSLCERMGGTITLESHPGRGSTFTAVIRGEAAELPTGAGLPDGPLLAGLRVLIVDDNATNRRILLWHTRKWGMVSRATPWPREALSWVERGEAFDLAILDLDMPEMDGVTLAVKLRTLRDRDRLHIVLLSSSRTGVGATLDRADFDAVLNKPIFQSQLYDALASIVHTGEATMPATRPPVAFDEELAGRVPLRVLVAEDNHVNQKVATLVLRKFGYSADVASNGREAVAAVRRQPYDLVLMDMEMPEMDGLDATRAIRALEDLPAQPRIVAMTANALTGDRERCIDAGMDDYITKPVDPGALAAALVKWGTSRKDAVP